MIKDSKDNVANTYQICSVFEIGSEMLWKGSDGSLKLFKYWSKACYTISKRVLFMYFKEKLMFLINFKYKLKFTYTLVIGIGIELSQKMKFLTEWIFITNQIFYALWDENLVSASWFKWKFKAKSANISRNMSKIDLFVLIQQQKCINTVTYVVEWVHAM